jgi:hypothetical protein
MHTTEVALCSIPARTWSSGGDGVCARNRTKPCLLFCVHRKEGGYSRFEGLRIKQSSVRKANRLAIVWIGVGRMGVVVLCVRIAKGCNFCVLETT